MCYISVYAYSPADCLSLLPIKTVLPPLSGVLQLHCYCHDRDRYQHAQRFALEYRPNLHHDVVTGPLQKGPTLTYDAVIA